MGPPNVRVEFLAAGECLIHSDGEAADPRMHVQMVLDFRPPVLCQSYVHNSVAGTRTEVH